MTIETEEFNVCNIFFGNDELMLQVTLNISEEEYDVLEEARRNKTVIEGTCCPGTTKCTLCRLGKTIIREINVLDPETARIYHCDTEWVSDNMDAIEKIFDILVQ